jgi:DNA-binding Xre family transcriptional regulator|uniref:helix-turn-helix domain-containing protein n=1 Tax=Fusobacterium mortiferum TaxID=850 RepID=UPI003FF0E1D2
MNKDIYISLLNKIENALYSKKIKKQELAECLGISKTALSNQLTNLKNGKGINTDTLVAVQKLTGINIFDINIESL